MPIKADPSRVYREEFERIKSRPLREELHRLVHDQRIPDGELRAYALRYARCRAGDLDHHGNFVWLPAPPSATQPVYLINRVMNVVAELVPWRAERFKALRTSGDHRTAGEEGAHVQRAA